MTFFFWRSKFGVLPVPVEPVQDPRRTLYYAARSFRLRHRGRR